jgi:hypothetical protein
MPDRVPLARMMADYGDPASTHRDETGVTYTWLPEGRVVQRHPDGTVTDEPAPQPEPDQPTDGG